MAEVRQNNEQSRFELDTERDVAVAYYELAGDVITFKHTEVPKELEGRGIGSHLVRGGLDIARARGLKVRARCSFVRAYLAKHHEYADLLAPVSGS